MSGLSEAIEKDFRVRVAEKVRLKPEGLDRFRVFTPFHFEDGDHLSIVLKRAGSNWVLSDEGHTFMHLTYDLEERDLQTGTRQSIIGRALEANGIADRNGELVVEIPDEQYGNALFTFIQGLLRITDVTYLSRERVRSTFLDDFRTLISELVPAGRRVFNWHHQTHDPDRNYCVDVRVNGMARPLLIFALPTDAKVNEATITLLKLEQWEIPGRGVGIFEDQQEVGRRVLARFSDASEKQFSSLQGNRDRIQRFLRDELATAN